MISIRVPTPIIAGMTTALVAGLVAAIAAPANAGVLVLNNGMQIEGRLGKVSSLFEDPGKRGADAVRLISFADDGLRRTFVSTYQVREVRESQPGAEQRFVLKQRVAKSGDGVASLGAILNVTPFDQFGRRIFTMATSKGKRHIVQGITEITPLYTKVEGLQGPNSTVLEMRLATASIPRDTLRKILLRNAPPGDADARLRIVQLLIASQRYKDAAEELEAAVREFPQLARFRQQLRDLRQLRSREMLKELLRRADAGQDRYVYYMLKNFPDQDVAGETLRRVREKIAEYDKLGAKIKAARQLLDDFADKLSPPLKQQTAAIRKEIADDLGLNNLPRLAAFLRLAENDKLTAESKIALAVSGWLLGAAEATENLPVALSLAETRDLVREYLRADNLGARTALLAKIKTQEGSQPKYLDLLLKYMKPPLDPPAEKQAAPGEKPPIPGFHKITIPGLPNQADIEYLIQLPPEYDPYRRYPTVVTLNGSLTDPNSQLEWWAGPFNPRLGQRMGQATRQGYIVISPHWARPQQTDYEYSAREHAAVLFSLRDAMKRFSIDSDRVFLSGHSTGGEAAWDIGLAHPDLWAGVMPFVATGEKYIERYWENARHAPFYFVAGELDGGKMATNGPILDRYLKRTGFDVTVTEYIGRGHEHFYDEVLRVFDWMSLHRRDFYPKMRRIGVRLKDPLTFVSLRPWDNFFYWVELKEIPAHATLLPINWNSKRSVRAAVTEIKIPTDNNIFIKSAATRVRVWLAPELIDFDKRVNISFRGRVTRGILKPNIEHMLEDARTRGDRQHAFWLRVDL